VCADDAGSRQVTYSADVIDKNASIGVTCPALTISDDSRFTHNSKMRERESRVNQQQQLAQIGGGERCCTMHELDIGHHRTRRVSGRLVLTDVVHRGEKKVPPTAAPVPAAAVGLGAVIQAWMMDAMLQPSRAKPARIPLPGSVPSALLRLVRDLRKVGLRLHICKDVLRHSAVAPTSSVFSPLAYTLHYQ
jgi:hypothetical protein